MAAYAAAVSLMHIIDLIKNHPSPPISLDKQQLDSLTEIVTFLQEFLEGYVSPFSNSDEADPLEMRITEAVYAAEDVIESYIVDSIHHPAAPQDEDEEIRNFNFYEGVQKVMEAMDMIRREVMGMVREKGGQVEADAGLGLDTGTSIERKSEMVGFDDVRLDLLDRLTGGDPNRQIIPVVGMGGIGKTTLSRNVFADKLIVEHFDICLWGTVSQDHNIERTLREVLSQAKLDNSSGTVAELGQVLHKYLFGKRYLVVMDDVWSIEVWDKIRNFFPDCGKRSRIIVTTRISNLTNSSNSLCMSFLNKDDSWALFSKTVFGSEGSVVPELREIGEKIVGKCKGLPLSIAVIGGLLAKSEYTQRHWEYIEKNLSSIVNLENEEYCLRVLKLSYNHLPAHLKPCFLYMGVFDEDSKIRVSTIINLWVSEGFLKQKRDKKNLETVAREYLQELVDRNLVVALDEEALYSRIELRDRELGSIGMTKLCKMHDLVRDLCLREAQKQRFYHVYSKHYHPSSHPHRRVVVPDHQTNEEEDVVCSSPIMLESSPTPRSYICHDHNVDLIPDFRLLRTLHTEYYDFLSEDSECTQKDAFGLVNARLLAISVGHDKQLRSSISRLWSLHTLLVHSWNEVEGPVEFWDMHQLKHVEFTGESLRLQLPPPLNNKNDNDNNAVILSNLHTLIGVVDLYLNENVVRWMPNLTVFDVRYVNFTSREVHRLSFLQRLTKLESFCCYIEQTSGLNLQGVCFPKSLKQIFLIHLHCSPKIELEGILQKIGRLPFVEELEIQGGVFKCQEWETTEGQFSRLRTLDLTRCGGLKKWIVTEASHFPLLQRLILEGLSDLEEFPSEIVEIATLKSIDLIYCSTSAVLSAKKVVEEQEDLYGEDQLSFRVLVENFYKKELESLATPNFRVWLRPRVRRPQPSRCRSNR